MANERNIVAWQLFEDSLTLKRDEAKKDTLYFQFNPSEMEESFSSDWEETTIQNGFAATTFKVTRPRVFKFDMFLNDWGNSSTWGSTNASVVRTVEQQIAWLQDKATPRFRGPNELYSPPILIFYWRDFYQVFITDIVVKRHVFKAFGGDTPSSESFDGRFKRYETQQRADTLLGKNFFGGTNQFSAKYPGPNDAIRAVVSVTLKQFIYATQEELAASPEKARQ